MNKENDKGLDDLFKRKLEDPVSPASYNEGDWDAMEQLLDGNKTRRGFIFWLPIISSAAAVLLFLAWWNFRPKTNQQPVILQAANHHQKPNRNSSTGVKTDTDEGPNLQQQSQPAVPTQSAYAATANINRGSKMTYSIPNVNHDNAATPAIENGEKDITANGRDGQLLSANFIAAFKPEQVTAEPVSAVNLQKNYPAASVNTTHVTKNRAQSAYRPVYALSVLAAPDINGVGSFQQSKVGTNVGLLFTAGVSKKFSVSTGVLYSDKPYLTAFENYHTPYQFQVNPVNVAENCKMLDIPLNIGYQVYNKHQNKLIIGTGLSSYLMLQESYKFNYADPYATGPTNFTVPHSNGYYFGVLNLNATYERQVTSKVGITLQPYLKLPLTNVGYSQVRLQTTGVAIGLSWNLNH